jgi:xylan 1,4-beta-xylosidase
MGWSMMIEGIAKPSFNAYRLLHRLGTRRLEAQGPALASRTDTGKVAVLVWNLARVPQPGGIPGMTADRGVEGATKRLSVTFDGAAKASSASIHYVEWERGSPMPAWRAMGSPQYPTARQIALLRKSAQPVTEHRRLDRTGTLKLELPPEGLALIELS